jgi:hypothetical protein
MQVRNAHASCRHAAGLQPGSTFPLKVVRLQQEGPLAEWSSCACGHSAFFLMPLFKLTSFSLLLSACLFQLTSFGSYPSRHIFRVIHSSPPLSRPITDGDLSSVTQPYP